MRLRLLAALFMAATFTLAAQKVPEKITTVEGITEYQLENGLKVLLFPDQSVPNITVNITYKVGSRHEAYGETGMAHLLEHLVFKGTPDHPDIPAELTSHGARPNGTTWYDRTNYYETFAASDENLDWALDMEADRMVNSFIAKKDLDSEMTVVRNEFESGENNPGGILMQRVLSSAYLWHNYGKSTIGSKADLENVPIERLQGFYRKYYQPDNAVLVVAGKIDEAKTLELIQEKFGKIPRPERSLYPTYTREPVQDGERFVELRRTGDVQVVQAAYHVPAGPHADYPAVSVLMDILTSQPSGRLYKALVEDGDASVVWGFAPALAEPGFAMFNVNVLKENDLAAVEAAFKETIEKIRTEAPTAEEVKRSKDKLLKNFELGQRDANRVGLTMSAYIAQGDWRLGFINRDRVKEVTPEDVMRVANTYFKPSNRTVGRFFPTEEPDRVEVPEVRDLSIITNGYVGGEAVAEGEAFDPSYDNIDQRTLSGKLGKKETIEFSLLPKETRGNSVQANMNARFGNLEALRGRAAAASFTGRMLMMGTDEMSRQDIQDKFDALKARVRIYGGVNSTGFSVETERDNLAEVIKLVGEIMRNPSFPEEEFAKMKKEQLAGIEQSRSDPQAIAFTEMSKRTNHFPKDHPYYATSFDESVERINSVTIEDVRKFYDDFYGGANITFGASGDMDAEEVKTALTEAFGDWKSPTDYVRIGRKHRDTKPDAVKMETPDKANAVFVATQAFPIGQDHPDYPALVMGNFMLGGGFLNSRLATRIRQKEGLSYGVGSNFNAGAIDKTGTFMAYAIYNPENREALEKAFREEIDKVRTEGFTAEELEAAKSGWVQSRQLSRAQDRSLASRLSNNLFLKRDMQWSKALEEKMVGLTPEAINKAMAKYLDVDKMLMVRAGDFAKAEAKRP
ncbi:M16 family metallopeptidase [Neolewinella agarilytica]|uniref:Zinc protease n=1 Tax=Neolewinella agarilytica TaxID=478744 RepID=A0A1H9JPC5_9BACT|nr:pitrilysin family protein [Neolewinella agarilytica]SEQ88690.1 zinc protease [Neolewinella agarilytica]